MILWKRITIYKDLIKYAFQYKDCNALALKLDIIQYYDTKEFSGLTYILIFPYPKKTQNL